MWRRVTGRVVSKDPSAFTQSTGFLELPDPENEGNTVFRDAGDHSPHDKALHSRKTLLCSIPSLMVRVPRSATSFGAPLLNILSSQRAITCPCADTRAFIGWAAVQPSGKLPVHYYINVRWYQEGFKLRCCDHLCESDPAWTSPL
jgi:hypothetical protein